MSDIFYTLIGCQAYKSRQKALKESWLKDVKNHYIFASDEDTEDSVKLSDRKDYYSCEEKQLSSLKYLTENKPNYKWYFFGDDDTYVNTKNLENLLRSFSSDSIGFVLSRMTDPYNTAFSRFNINAYYSGGAGFCFSQKLLMEVKDGPFPPSIHYADISMARLLGNVKFTHCNSFCPTSPTKLGHSESKIREMITYHYVSETEMNQLHEINSK